MPHPAVARALRAALVILHLLLPPLAGLADAARAHGSPGAGFATPQVLADGGGDARGTAHAPDCVFCRLLSTPTTVSRAPAVPAAGARPLRGPAGNPATPVSRRHAAPSLPRAPPIG